MRTRTAIGLVAAALFAAVAGAEEQAGAFSTLVPGDRVRVEVLGNRETLTATIESVTVDDLVLSASSGGQPVRLSLGQLDVLEVARGRRTQWRKGALIGLIPGAALGGLLGVAVACDPDVAGCESGFTLGAGFVGAVLGAAITAPIGALVGLAFKTDRWVRVYEGRQKVSLILAPAKGEMRLALSVGF